MSIELPSSHSQGGAFIREGSSSRELHDGLFIPDTAKSKGNVVLGSQVAWATLAKAHFPDYVALGLLAGITLWCEMATPFSKVIYNENDQEYWKYSFPLHQKNTVPAWTVPLIATAVPLLVIVSIATSSRLPRFELHNLILGLFASVLITACVTNLVKLGVGRPRPNFAARCWPNGNFKFSQEGLPLCAPNAVNPGEGQKSFPSGIYFHSSVEQKAWPLRQSLSCQPWRLITSFLPLSVSVWIGITRLQDYWHHWEDVVAGFFLALMFAYLCYRLQYQALLGAKTGELISDGENETGHVFSDLEAAVGL